MALAELSVGPLVAPTDEDRVARQAHLQAADADFDPLSFDAAAASASVGVATSLRRSGRRPTARADHAMIAATAIAAERVVGSPNAAVTLSGGRPEQLSDRGWKTACIQGPNSEIHMTDRMSTAERKELGRSARSATPRHVHGDWSPDPARPDPVSLLDEQNRDRMPWLVPIRHARMRVSPFTFYRGAARIMAADLAETPISGLKAQIGGDAHLSNFGAYASPERQLVFDQNDFDETLPGPWEWDLKRLATSFVIAAQHLGFVKSDCRRAASEVTRSYRDAMARFAKMGFLELWYDYVSTDDVAKANRLGKAPSAARIKRFERQAMGKNSAQALTKLAEKVDGKYRIRTELPVLFPLRDLPDEADPSVFESAATAAFQAYEQTVDDHMRFLLDRYELIDIGVKVVGVGSVGTRCLVLLLEGRDDQDPLFLQAKEANASVLEEHLGPSRFDNHGRRVVEGQRLTQAQTDIFLGWTEGKELEGRHFYVRQLRDWKGSVEVEGATPNQLAFYAGLCGTTLARGHARSGDATAIRAYCGGGGALDNAITAFAESYAAQNLEDFHRFEEAIASGRLEVAPSGR